jgi:ribosomal protein S18 acetylase RimI-like enzyme
LDVEPCFQGKGIGLRLLKAAEEEMLTCGIRKIRLEVSVNNLSALRLYEKAGFTMAAFLHDFYLNPFLGARHALRMIKNLA